MSGTRRCHKLILIFLIILSPLISLTQAQAVSSSAMMPEALGAKAFLEDLLARRYAQELATTVDRQAFSLGAQLDLIEIPSKIQQKPGATAEAEPLSDLMLGTLDPEELLKKYAGTEERPTSAQRLLENYRIRTVQVSVGLRDDLSPEVKGDVEKWLSSRLNEEFGKAGKGVVTAIKTQIEKKATPKTILDWLLQFQSLAGQIVLALGLLLGILFWQILNSKGKAKENGDSVVINNSTGGAAGPSPAEAAAKKQRDDEEKQFISREFESFNKRINSLAPRLTNELEAVVRSWCQLGDAGKLRLACFAESVGREVGKLPIPIDALADVSKVFARMTEVSMKERRDALEKAYWDLLTALNLGADALNQPFGYMGGLKLGMINQVLMDQNPKMKTLVSLFMPTDLRLRYLKGLPLETKRELLDSAALLSNIGEDELKTIERSLKSKLQPQGAANVIPLEFTLNKVVSALSPSEEVTLLSTMTGAAIEEFKRSTPSLAFLAEWPKNMIARLLSSVTSDQVVALLRVRPDLSVQVIDACPPMTAEMVNEEYARPDRLSDKDKDQFIALLSTRLKELVDLKEVILEDIFKAPQPVETSGPGQGPQDDSQSAA